ncbi:MAG: AAA family ATPase, partial [Myxococcota bacterium]|nr:AAA family ATPase [Myxococcota bacterium]
VEDLWATQAVGFIGGTPKAGKTWLALELAVAVASGRPCLGLYPVHEPGHVLLYAAEDTAQAIKERTLGIAQIRGVCDTERLAIGLITTPQLWLDLDEHQQRLATTVARVKPRLLVLDPLVRIHRADENSAAEISRLLAFLRHLQREHAVAIVVVHHVRKSASAQPGQALRGSGDLHAWSDSSLYLLRRKGRTELHVEHRSQPGPAPAVIELHTEDPPHLRIITAEPDKSNHGDGLAERVLTALAEQPMTRTRLREHLRVRNETLGSALTDLEAQRRIRRSNGLIVPVPIP